MSTALSPTHQPKKDKTWLWIALGCGGLLLLIGLCVATALFLFYPSEVIIEQSDEAAIEQGPVPTNLDQAARQGQ